jgi:hypothetical protein
MLATMPRRHEYAGSCHCRNIAIRFESDKSPPDLPLRTDTCSFCNKHRAAYTSDAQGEMHFAVRDENSIERYRFGTKTADFLICKSCGVFVAACMTEPPLAVINVNALDARADFLKNELGVADLDSESLEQRLARRRARWTPVVSFVGATAADRPRTPAR